MRAATTLALLFATPAVSVEPPARQAVLGQHTFLTGKVSTKPLPEQGFEGDNVEHRDGETKTDDWLKEHGANSKPQRGAVFLTFGGAPAKTLAPMADRLFHLSRGLHASTRGSWPQRPGVQGSLAAFMRGPLPEQGFEGPPVEHKDGETHTDDWGCEYGSCGGKTTKATTAAPEGATGQAVKLTAEPAPRMRSMADHIFVNSQGLHSASHGRRKSMADFMKPLPEQGYEGDGVEHKDGETATGDWGCEYGPCSSNTTTPRP